jgi:uncharacterized glyoxalase superfamily protein PhnB
MHIHAMPGLADILRAATYLPVPDVGAAGTYYRDTLGFVCEYEAGTPTEFAIYRRGRALVMFRRAQPGAKLVPNEKQGGTWDIFLWTNAVDALFAELARNGAAVVTPPTVMPYGMKEFAVRDPNGYILGFGQEWPTAS